MYTFPCTYTSPQTHTPTHTHTSHSLIQLCLCSLDSAFLPFPWYTCIIRLQYDHLQEDFLEYIPHCFLLKPIRYIILSNICLCILIILCMLIISISIITAWKAKSFSSNLLFLTLNNTAYIAVRLINVQVIGIWVINKELNRNK